MEKYEAFHAAADFIEKNPDRYSFSACTVPDKDCGVGCMWGWAGVFMGVRSGSWISKVYSGAAEEMALYTFGSHLHVMNGSEYDYGTGEGAAKVMREYAEMYLKPVAPPAVVAAAPALEPAYIKFKHRLRRWARVRAFFKLKEETV